MGVSQDYEGWSVRARPAAIAMALFVAILVTAVIAAALVYNARYEPQTRPHPEPFPAPVLETVMSAPADPVPPRHAPPDHAKAMAQTVAVGDALWKQAR
jgi:hypothetical protein